MKPIRGMLRGVKQKPKLNKTEAIQSMDKKLSNLEMAGRVSQMMIQQVVQNVQSMSQDLGKAFATINELQYKILAMQSVGNFDMKAMQTKAEELRLNDFIEASDAEDKQGNFSIGDKVQDSSTVIITSTTTADGAGIFRSRIKLAECGVPDLIKGLTGQPVGTKVACKLNGADHMVELLGIRNPPPTNVIPHGEVIVNADGSESQEYVRVSADQVH